MSWSLHNMQQFEKAAPETCATTATKATKDPEGQQKPEQHIPRTDTLLSLPPEPSALDANVVLFKSRNDPDNPFAWSAWKKWRVLGVVQLCCLCVTMNATIVTGAYDDLRSYFSISRHIVILSVSFYVVGLGFGSILSAPLSELYGRRPVYLTSFALFVLFTVPLVFLPRGRAGFVLLCFVRFLQGFVASAHLSVANGTISDVFDVNKAFLPVSFYAQVPFLGPVLGPLVGALLDRTYEPGGHSKSDELQTWHLTIYFTITLCSSAFLLLLLFVPETYTPILLVHRARRLRDATGNTNLYALHEEKMRTLSPSSSRQPLLLVILRATLFGCFLPLLKEPLLLILSLWSALLLSILYLFFQLFPLVFGAAYTFTPLKSSLSLLGIVVGMLLAMLSMPLWSILYARQLRPRLKNTENKRSLLSYLFQRPAIASPEARLPMALLGCFLGPISLFLFATSTRGPSSAKAPPHWILPILSTAPFGVALIFLFTPLQLFLNETYLPVVASATAVSVFIRSTSCASLPIFTHFLNEKIGARGLGIVLAVVQLLMIPIPFTLYFFGPRIRKRSRFYL